MITKPQVGVKQIAGLLGLLCWYKYATNQDLFALAKFYRTLADTVQINGWLGFTDVTPQILELCGLLRACKKVRCSHKVSEHRACIVSDASLKGHGSIEVTSGRNSNGTWTKAHLSKDMFLLEACAASLGLKNLASQADAVLIITDNKGLCQAINKRCTSCPRTGPILQAMSRNREVRSIWIPTALNPADELSRGELCCVKKLDDMWSWVCNTYPLFVGGSIRGGWSGARHAGRWVVT